VDGCTDIRTDGWTYLLMDGHSPSNVTGSTRRSQPTN